MELERYKSWDGKQRGLQLNGHATFIDIYPMDGCVESPLSEDQADELLGICEEFVEDCIKKNCTDKYSIETYSDYIVVQKDKTVLIGFFIGENDIWKYGISTKAKALELAEKFIEFSEKYEEGCCWLLPSTVEIVKDYYLEKWYIRKNGKDVATFFNKKDAYDFAGKYAPVKIDKHGLESLSNDWNRGILTYTEDIPRAVLTKLSEYIFDNW